MNVVVYTDDNYVTAVSVMLYSLISTSRQECYFNIYILCNGSLSDFSKKQLNRLNKPNKCSIIYSFFSDIVIDKAKIYSYVTKANYYRFLIPELIPDSRCLYLDGDILINHDLSDIYNSDFESNCIMVVRDYGFILNASKYYFHAQSLGLREAEDYFNAGGKLSIMGA